jgi:exodeoxyribonuclease VII large subunit
MIEPPQPGQPLGVAQAITLFNTILGDLSLVIEGEIANYNVNQGKFVFFDLKDETHDARLGCFMMLFKQNVPVEDGMRVKVLCRPTIHSKSGKFSLTVERIEPVGEGSLKRAFELLKKKLEAEGLFSPARKRPLPKYPERVGVISSSSAAGYGDFMRIAGQRLPSTSFLLANVTVQGSEAEEDICFAFDYLNSYYDLDCIVLVRGGGSMEDLHAFNSEQVARAIVRSKAPVIVGVGHERDETIADYCADLRAATPSNAAQLLLPTAENVLQKVAALTSQGRRLVERRVSMAREKTAQAVERGHQVIYLRLRSAQQYVQQLTRTLDALSPEATLQRGYSITWTEAQAVMRDPAMVKTGDKITTQAAGGTVTSTIL